MNQLRRLGVGLIMALVGMFCVVGNAFAAIDLIGVTFPMTECEAIAALMLAALAGLWVIRKVLSLVRSR